MPCWLVQALARMQQYSLQDRSTTFSLVVHPAFLVGAASTLHRRLPLDPLFFQWRTAELTYRLSVLSELRYLPIRLQVLVLLSGLDRRCRLIPTRTSQLIKASRFLVMQQARVQLLSPWPSIRFLATRFQLMLRGR